MQHHLFLAAILLLSTALPVISAPKWQEYGVTTEGKSMSLDSSSPKRDRGGNIIIFKYRVTDRDGKQNVRTATSEDCFVGNSRALNGHPSRWNVKLEDVWMPVIADSEASKNMLINACRIANGGQSQPIASYTSTTNKTLCPNPFPSTYKSPQEKKRVEISNLGIMVKVPKDHRLVYIRQEKRYTFMSPPEYDSYQCSLKKKVDYTSFYPFPYEMSYKIIDNSREQSLPEVLKTKITYIQTENFGQLRINDIDFLTTPKDQEDPVAAWFIPKGKPNIIIQYSRYCDCGVSYNDLVSEVDDIENIAF